MVIFAFFKKKEVEEASIPVLPGLTKIVLYFSDFMTLSVLLKLCSAERCLVKLLLVEMQFYRLS